MVAKVLSVVTNPLLNNNNNNNNINNSNNNGLSLTKMAQTVQITKFDP